MLIYRTKAEIEGRRATVVGLEENGTLSLGVAISNPKDNFSKRLGKKIALGRALKKPIIVPNIDGKITQTSFIALASELASKKISKIVER